MNPSAPDRTSHAHAPTTVTIGSALRVWALIGWLGFGGPAGQIALMHRQLVERRRWISDERFLHALNYCMLLPGPEATQLAIYIGWLMHGTVGGVVAGVLFVLPGVIVIFCLSWLYVAFQQVGMLTAVFFGLKAAVLAVVVEAVLRIGRRALQNRTLAAIAAVAFVAIHFFHVPFPLIVLGAAGAGIVGRRVMPRSFPAPSTAAMLAAGDYYIDQRIAGGTLDPAARSLRRTLRLTGLCVALWALPLIAVVVAFGRGSVFAQQGVLFSEAAVVTFGGAYAVLAYIAQRAVADFAWLAPGEMLDGLALAETTPGPLIMVVQFVAFIGAFRHPGGLPPFAAAALGSLLTVWVTFVPCFLWILVGAPYIENLRNQPLLRAALSAITAAVVGVVLNLSVWFAIHTLFHRVEALSAGPLHFELPVWSTLDPAAVVLALVALVAMLRLRIGMGWTLLICGACGAAWRLL
jgi:chromate transporter